MPLDLPVFSIVLVAAWLLIFGGSVGSFLNVVAYRLPLGLSLVRPPHCPACKTPIAWHDNVPVLGWLWVRGRCRACGVWISPRYPVVEAIAAGMFLAVGWLEIVAGGVNLPHDTMIYGGGQVVWPAPLFVRAVLCAYHLLLLSTLLPAVLMEIDGSRVPWRLGWPAAVVGVAGAVAWPWVHPLHAFRMTSLEMLGPVDAAAGLAAGCLVAWAVGRLARPTAVTACGWDCRWWGCCWAGRWAWPLPRLSRRSWF